MVFGFVVAALWLSAAGVPDAAGVGAATVAVAVLVIARPHAALVRALSAGVLSGIWMTLLRADSVPAFAAAAIAVLLPATSAWLSARRPSFAPPPLREEATLLVLVLAAIVAAAPTLVAGWRSAVALNLQQPGGTAVVVPEWAVLLTVTAFGLGGLFTAWRRG